MRSHPCAWRVECRYPTGLGNEHAIRYTVCLWTTFALTEKGDHLFKCASSSHWFQALTCSNVTLFRSSKHSVVCTTDLSAGWVSPDAWQPGQVSKCRSKAPKLLLTEFGYQLNPRFFFHENSSNNRHQRPHGHSTWFLESKHWRLSLLLALLVLRNAMGTRPARWGRLKYGWLMMTWWYVSHLLVRMMALLLRLFFGQSSMFRF